MIREFLPWKKDENHVVRMENGKNPVDEFHRQFSDLFNHFFGNDVWWAPNDRAGSFAPCFEVNESGDRICVTAELPGVPEKDVDISVDDGLLCIKGEKRSEHDDNDQGYHFSERSYGSFQRTFALPDGIDVEKIAAKFKDGVLTITLPRDRAKPETARKIKITAA